jgi:hypothetical protein
MLHAIDLVFSFSCSVLSVKFAQRPLDGVELFWKLFKFFINFDLNLNFRGCFSRTMTDGVEQVKEVQIKWSGKLRSNYPDHFGRP